MVLQVKSRLHLVLSILELLLESFDLVLIVLDLADDASSEVWFLFLLDSLQAEVQLANCRGRAWLLDSQFLNLGYIFDQAGSCESFRLFISSHTLLSCW